MTVTVQELITYLQDNLFQDGATVQVEHEGVTAHLDDVKKDDNGNAILIIASGEDDSDEDDSDDGLE